MNLNHKHQLIAATLMLFSIPAFAEWNKDMSVEYLMGDGDNRASARQAALEVLKVKASAEVGTYVQTTTTLHDTGNLTENIQTLGASMVKLSNVHDTLSVNQGGQAVLLVTARAAVDDSELSKRIEALRQDKDKARQLTVLQKENELLRHDLEEIHNALSAKSNKANIAELISRQNETIRRLSENSQSITQVFEPGALLQMASKNTDGFNLIKNELDEKLFAPLLKTEVHAEIVSVNEEKDGYTANVDVWWDIQTGVFIDILNPYFREVSRIDRVKNGDGFKISSYTNREGKGKSIYSEKLYDYLESKLILMRINIFGKSSILPVLYGSETFFRNEECYDSPVVTPNSKVICLVSRPKYDSNQTLVHRPPLKVHLTKDEAAMATHVEAHFVMK